MVALSFIYFLVLSITDLRFSDGELYWQEMHIYEIPIFFVLLLGIIVLWFKGVSSCVRAGNTDKVILCFVVWPYSVYLALKYSGQGQLNETT